MTVPITCTDCRQTFPISDAPGRATVTCPYCAADVPLKRDPPPAALPDWMRDLQAASEMEGALPSRPTAPPPPKPPAPKPAGSKPAVPRPAPRPAPPPAPAGMPDWVRDQVPPPPPAPPKPQRVGGAAPKPPDPVPASEARTLSIPIPAVTPDMQFEDAGEDEVDVELVTVPVAPSPYGPGMPPTGWAPTPPGGPIPLTPADTAAPPEPYHARWPLFRLGLLLAAGGALLAAVGLIARDARDVYLVLNPPPVDDPDVIVTVSTLAKLFLAATGTMLLVGLGLVAGGMGVVAAAAPAHRRVGPGAAAGLVLAGTLGLLATAVVAVAAGEAVAAVGVGLSAALIASGVFAGGVVVHGLGPSLAAPQLRPVGLAFLLGTGIAAGLVASVSGAAFALIASGTVTAEKAPYLLAAREAVGMLGVAAVAGLFALLTWKARAAAPGG